MPAWLDIGPSHVGLAQHKYVVRFAVMLAKPVQISLEVALLKRVDRDPETRKLGRSAFIQSAIQLYLRVKERQDVDESIRKAYASSADDMLSELEGLIEAQAWPEK
jgi:metal-responsive CopG/Arc/MetJ family transcriptional regulator